MFAFLFMSFTKIDKRQFVKQTVRSVADRVRKDRYT